MKQDLILCGDAARLLTELPEQSVDLVITDPPYLVSYKDRSGRTLRNDDNTQAVMAVFEPLARTMKQHSYAICFAGWSALPEFTAAWKKAGLDIVSQFVWEKGYTSSSRYAEYRHETAYVLAKGRPSPPVTPLPSVLPWTYSGNRTHPTEKAVEVIMPLVRCFSQQGDLVCDPFAGSGTSCVAAALTHRRYIGIDIDAEHCRTANNRLRGVKRFHGDRGKIAARMPESASQTRTSPDDEARKCFIPTHKLG